MNPPKISVVTVCWNAASTIEKTLESVRSQVYPNLEHVIVDGGSTDGTLAIVDRYRERIATVVSEKDRGIYDAMNKGVRLSTGDVVYFLNADDSFVDERVVADVAQAFAEDDRRLLVYGDVVYQEAPDGIVYGPARAFKSFSIHEFIHNPFCHQAVFAKRSLFDDPGPFDLRYKYVADYEWFMRVFKSKPEGLHCIDRKIANYFFAGRSYTQSTVTRREKSAAYFRHMMSPYTLWYTFRYHVVRGWKKKLMGETW